MSRDNEHPVDDFVRRAVGVDDQAVASTWSASEAKKALLQEITAMPTEAPDYQPTRQRFTFRRLAVVGAVGVMTLGTGVMAVAERGPFDDPVQDACEPDVGENYPTQECADYVIPQAVEQIEQDGTAEAREAIADGVVSRDEYDAAAERWKQCAIDNGLTTFQLVPEDREIGFAYAAQWKHVEGLDDEEMFAINDRCAEQHFRLLNRIWEAQHFPVGR